MIFVQSKVKVFMRCHRQAAFELDLACSRLIVLLYGFLSLRSSSPLLNRLLVARARLDSTGRTGKGAIYLFDLRMCNATRLKQGFTAHAIRVVVSTSNLLFEHRQHRKTGFEGCFKARCESGAMP